MATEEVERQTSTRKPRSSCWADFAGTLFSLVFSVPLLGWIFSIVKDVFDSGASCEVLLLLKEHLSSAIMIAALFIGSVILLQLGFACFRGKCGALVVSLLFFSVFLVGSDIPNLEGENRLGLFHSSPMVAADHNNSEYWNNNIKTCLCKDEDCEDLVYRNYLLLFYNLRSDDFGFSSFTRLDEAKRIQQTTQDLNGTSVKNGDRSSPSPSPSFDKNYHEVCYFKSSGDMGNKTCCYSCYGCEEQILRDDRKNLWKIANQLSVLGFLLIVSNMTMFLAESWARYMG